MISGEVKDFIQQYVKDSIYSSTEIPNNILQIIVGMQNQINDLNSELATCKKEISILKEGGNF